MAFPISPAIGDEEYAIRLGECYSKALNHSDRSTFRKQHPSEYDFIYARGLLNDVCSHMPKKRFKYQESDIVLELSKFKSLKAFRKANTKMYDALRHRKNFKSLTRGLVNDIRYKHSGYSEQEEIAIINSYKHSSDLKRDYPAIYKAFREKYRGTNLVKEFIPKRENKMPLGITGVYMLKYKGKVVYIGKSDSCIYDRVRCHNRDKVFDSVAVYESNNAADISILEIFCISRLNPQYNKSSFQKGDCSLLQIENLNSLFTKEYKINKEI